MSQRRMPSVLLSTLLLAATAVTAAAPLAAQTAPAPAPPWSGPVRGTWVQTGPAAAGDVVLAAAASGAEIVLAPSEPLNVRQAATFLAGDIEK
ncbi:MAG TPA: hypothetical protein VEH62_05385, partial [Gemmatimonadales bacterium]|nr:hypothetical protein [Gemmatimonadales bacterium]